MEKVPGGLANSAEGTSHAAWGNERAGAGPGPDAGQDDDDEDEEGHEVDVDMDVDMDGGDQGRGSPAGQLPVS